MFCCLPESRWFISYGFIFFVFFGSSSAYPPNFRFYFTKKIFIGVSCRCQSNYPRKTQRAGGYWTIKKPPVIVTDGFYLFVENVSSISAVYYPLFCSAPLQASACRYSDIRWICRSLWEYGQKCGPLQFPLITLFCVQSIPKRRKARRFSW